MRGLDHVVQIVPDLDRAAAVLNSLGLTVAAKSRHPFGTANRCVHFNKTYWELLTIEDTDKIIPHTAKKFSFSAASLAFWNTIGSGCSGLVGSSSDADADCLRFQNLGLPSFEVNAFGRTALGPDGIERPVSFRVAHTEIPDAPNLSVFFNSHQMPDNFWRPELAQHASQTVALDEVILVAQDPSALGKHLAQLFETTPDLTKEGISLPLERARLLVTSLEGLHNMTGLNAPLMSDQLPRIAGLSLSLNNVAHVEKAVRDHGLDVKLTNNAWNLVCDSLPGSILRLTVSN